MKKFKSLKILDKVSFIFKKSNVDYDVMRKILEVKLTLDSRRESAFNRSQSKKDEDTSNGFWKSYWIYALFGLFMIPLGFLGDSPFIGLNLFFGIILFMLISSMISDFSSVILDTKDKLILLTKPVSPETLTAARFIHILIYLMTLMLVLTVPGIISFAYNYGLLFGVLLLLFMGLLCLLSILGTSFIYTILMRLFDGEKLKDIINIFQIFFILTLNIGYQVLIRMFRFIDFEFVFTPKWWTYLLPPSWFAAPFEMIFFAHFEIEYIILSLLALVIPVLSFIIHVKVIAPGFEQYLSKLDAVETGKIEKKNLRYRIRSVIDNIVAKTNTEKTFKKFTRIMLKKERSVKFKVYPLLAMAFVFPVIFMVMSALNYENTSLLTTLGDRSTVFYFYLSSLMISQVIMLTSFSDAYKGAWVYGVMPIEDKNEILKGAIKGLLITYVLPIAIFFLCIGLYLYGFYAILDFTIVFSASFISMMLSFKSSKKRYPFSEKFTQENQKEDSVKNIFITMGIIGIYFIVHKFAQRDSIYLLVFAILAMIINLIMWKLAFKGEWETYE
ncbi:MAG: hypothetical protein WBA54_15220 [Acidaminobacteraceae bacterium]